MIPLAPSFRPPVVPRWFPFAGLLILLTAGLSAADPTPLPQAHSHNDYRRPRPLLDALEQGFGSVEADIWLVDGELRVGHDRVDLRPGVTLQKLYLDPLLERTRTRGGRVYTGLDGFTLLVDIKAESERVWPVLRGVLAGYRPMLTRFTDQGVVTGAVTVILSGDRPTAAVAGEAERWCGLDARVPDLARNPSRFLYPLVSDNWRSLFGGMVEGRLGEADRAKLRALTVQAHEQGRRIRFWGVPDEAGAWREMKEAGVDLLNTDRLAGLGDFLRSGARSAP